MNKSLLLLNTISLGFLISCGNNSYVAIDKEEVEQYRNGQTEKANSGDAISQRDKSGDAIPESQVPTTPDEKTSPDDTPPPSDEVPPAEEQLSMSTPVLENSLSGSHSVTTTLTVGDRAAGDCTGIEYVDVTWARSDGEFYRAVFMCGQDPSFDTPISESGSLPWSDIARHLTPGSSLAPGADFTLHKQNYAWDTTLTKGAPYAHTFELSIEMGIRNELDEIHASQTSITIPEYYYIFLNETFYDSATPESGDYSQINLEKFSFGPCSISNVDASNYDTYFYFNSNPDRHLLKTSPGWEVYSYTDVYNETTTLNPITLLNDSFPQADNAVELSNALPQEWQWGASDYIKEHINSIYGGRFKSWIHQTGPLEVNEQNIQLSRITLRSQADPHVHVTWCNLDDNKIHF